MAATALVADREIFRKIALKITAITGVQLGDKQESLVASRLSKHLRNLGGMNPSAYWDYLNKNEKTEIPVLISLLTTHHTFFFREIDHFDFVARELGALVRSAREAGRKEIRVWSAACSTGEEAYSLAMFLDYQLKLIKADIGFRIFCSDVAPQSVESAKSGVFNNREVAKLPMPYNGSEFWIRGKGSADGFSKLREHLRSRCEFRVANLLDLKSLDQNGFDLVFCRNVFIYFKPQEVERITNDLLSRMNEGACLFIGMSESLTNFKLPLDHIGKSIYRKKSSAAPVTVHAPASTTLTLAAPSSPAKAEAKKSVLIVQTQNQIGAHCKTLLDSMGNFSCIGNANVATSEEARQLIFDSRPDMLITDSRSLGKLRFLLKDTHLPLMILDKDNSDELGMPQALWIRGDFLKEEADHRQRLQRALTELARRPTAVPTQKVDNNCLIAIGASTGGTEALRRIISVLPAQMPPILIVQHIPGGFSRDFAQSLNDISKLKVKEAADGDQLLPGTVLVAPGGRQLEISGRPGNHRIAITHSDKVSGHCPSVDVMMESVAKHVKDMRLVGVILTGMGSDGAKGLLEMRKAGALTLGQDEASCVVYGMPKIAKQLGAVSKEISLAQLPQEMVQAVKIRIPHS